jgi:hypothetical protein
MQVKRLECATFDAYHSSKVLFLLLFDFWLLKILIIEIVFAKVVKLTNSLVELIT